MPGLLSACRGGSKDGGAFIEYLDGTDDVQGGKKVKRHLFQLGYETKIGDKQWLQIAVGGGGGAYSKTVLGVNLSFNLSPDRQINERGEVQKLPSQVTDSTSGVEGRLSQLDAANWD